MRSEINNAITLLLRYCRDHGWAGYDPYDALNSRLLQSLGVYSFSFPRLAATQFLKRCPVNLRPLLLVPREQNPKGVALFLSALVRLVKTGEVESNEARKLASRLLELRSPHQPHFCWGYNFAWQTRTYLVPRGTPNIISTTFAGNALLDAYVQFGDAAYLDAAIDAGYFLLEGLQMTTVGDCFCFGYTPLDRVQVHNANLLGAAFLARIHSLRPNEQFKSAALSSAKFSVDRQRSDGSWPYAETLNQTWIDSFHTGYNLVALQRMRQIFGMDELDVPIRRGYKFYLDHFFARDGVPKYFHDRIWPVDIHSSAQALITVSELREYDERSMGIGAEVCAWTLKHMRSPGGWFYFQKKKFWTNRIPYMRWSQAWMLLALAQFQESSTAQNASDPALCASR